MADEDKREVFPTLEDIDDNNNGVALSQAHEGDPVAGRNFAGMLLAKDAANNLQFPLVNAQRELVVDTDSGEVAELEDAARIDGNAAETLVAKITLQADKTYKNLGWSVGCFRDALYRIVSVNDVGVTDVEDELHPGIAVGSGDFQDSHKSGIKFVAGDTGVVELQLLAKNLNALSNLRGSIYCEEIT